jgi:SAM-dependent methyltransferase
MGQHPDQFSDFYLKGNISIDIKLINIGYRYLKKYFKGENCLELGPATGYMTHLLLSDFKRVVAVEGAADLLEQIPEANHLVKVHALFEEFQTTELFGTIMLNHVLEHIENPVELLVGIRKWLAPDGVLIVGVPNAKSFHRLAAVKMGLLETEYQLNERDIALGHHRVYDLNLLKEHALLAGYHVKFEGGTFLKYLSNAQMEKIMDDTMLEAYHELAASFVENSAEIYLVLSLT